MAELYRNNLYILFDLPDSPSSAVIQEVLSQIMEQALDHLRPKPRTSKAKLIEACQRTRRLHLAALQGQRQDIQRQIKELEGRLRLMSAQLAEIGEGLRGIDLSEDRIGEAFERLESLPHVKQVKIADDHLLIITDEIFLQDSGKTYLLGKYQIKVPLKEGIQISIKNEEPKRVRSSGKVLHHPHVVGERVCLGNMAEGISEYLKLGHYELVAELLIEFLHSVNPGDPYYKNLMYWKPLEKSRPCTCGRKEGK